MKNVSFWILTAALFNPLLASAHSTLTPHTLCGDLNRAIQESDIPCLVDELIEGYFPELQKAYSEGRIELKGLSTPDYFFKTWQYSGYFTNNRSKRNYAVRINPGIYAPATSSSNAPSMLAIQGILAHELFHIADYEAARAGGFIKVAGQELFTNAKYERYTDLRTMRLGFTEGLSAYRVWIYSKLDGRALALKRKRYFTPEEITEWVSAQGDK